MVHLKAISQPLSLTKIAYEALRDNIMTGRLETGTIYSEMSIAKEMGISRTPVREALLELSAQGIVKFLPRKGLIIRQYNSEDVIEIFELRKAIEYFAVEKIAKNKTTHDFSEAKEALKNQQKALEKGDTSSFLVADRAFHLSLTKLTDNNRLVSNLNNIRDIIHLMGGKVLAKDSHSRGKEILIEHEKLLEAIELGNSSQAKKAIEYHLSKSEKAVLRAYQSL